MGSNALAQPSARREGGARDRLIAASAEVFRESGYRAASLDTILRRSGVAKSNFYYHFSGKLALASAALDAWKDRIQSQPALLALEDGSLSGLERLHSFVAGFQETCCEGPYGCPFGMLAAEDDLEPELRGKVAAAFRRIEEGLRGAIRAGVRDGSIRPDVEAEPMAAALLATVQGAGLLGRAGRDTSRVPDCAEPVLDLISA